MDCNATVKTLSKVITEALRDNYLITKDTPDARVTLSSVPTSGSLRSELDPALRPSSPQQNEGKYESSDGFDPSLHSRAQRGTRESGLARNVSTHV